MTPAEFVQNLEEGQIPSPQVPPDGSGDALFARVLALYGEAPDQAVSVARLAKSVTWPKQERASVLRAQGLGAYCAGRWLESARLFRAAAALQPREERCTYAIPAIDALARAGKVQEAIELGNELIRQLGPKSVMAARARINLGNAQEQSDDLRSATRSYLLAVKVLQATDYQLDLAKAHSGAAAGLIAKGELDQAKLHAEAARAIFESADQPNFVAIVDANLAQIEIARGRPDAGLLILLQCRESMPDWRVAWLDELTGDAYLALNIWTSAADAYRAVLSNPATKRNQIGYASALYGLACAEDGLNRPREALATLRQARRRHAALGNDAMVAMDDLLASEIAIRGRKWNVAQARARRAATAARRAGFTTLSDRLELVGARAQIELKSFSPELLARLRGYTKSPIPVVAWRSWHLVSLIETGTARRRAQHRMMTEILRSRLALQSSAGRIGFLADKQAAIQSLLQELLMSADPQDHRFALETLLQTRSATLLDEIQSSFRSQTNDWSEEFNEIRAEISGSFLEDDGINFRRLVPNGATPNLRRRWSEASRERLNRFAARQLPVSSQAQIYVSTPSSLFIIHRGGSVKNLHTTASEFNMQLAKTRFELGAPLLDGKADPGTCYEALDSLRALLQPTESDGAISPDDHLWGVPWPAICADVEPVLCLSPAWTETSDWHLPQSPRVLVWLGDQAVLPNIGAELEILRITFSDLTICRTRAEAVASMQDGAYDLLHVAAHGIHESANPMFSAIQFPDGRLFAAEVAASSLRLQYAVLLSCDSGKLTASGGSEPDGWIRAVLARGAEAAVATGWLIEDASALTFARSLYAAWTKGHDLRLSARLARQMLKTERPHPFFWASPVLFAGYVSPLQSLSEKP